MSELFDHNFLARQSVPDQLPVQPATEPQPPVEHPDRQLVSASEIDPEVLALLRQRAQGVGPAPAKEVFLPANPNNDAYVNYARVGDRSRLDIDMPNGELEGLIASVLQHAGINESAGPVRQRNGDQAHQKNDLPHEVGSSFLQSRLGRWATKNSGKVALLGVIGCSAYGVGTSVSLMPPSIDARAAVANSANAVTIPFKVIGKALS